MAKTYQQLEKQIETLRREAETLKRKEAVDVIARIKEAIEAYGLTVSDLFGRGVGGSKPAAGKRQRSKRSASAQYRDDQGNEWGGRGPRPRWLRDAIQAGKTLEEFAVQVAAPAKAPKAASRGKKNAAAIKYKDGNGNVWGGRGPRPRWLAAALSEGRTLEEFAA